MVTKYCEIIVFWGDLMEESSSGSLILGLRDFGDREPIHRGSCRELLCNNILCAIFTRKHLCAFTDAFLWICEIFKNISFYKTPLVAASAYKGHLWWSHGLLYLHVNIVGHDGRFFKKWATVFAKNLHHSCFTVRNAPKT